MNQLGESILEGAYILNNALRIKIKSVKGNPSIYLRSSLGSDRYIKIHTSVQNGSSWKIWYFVNKKEIVATIKKAP